MSGRTIVNVADIIEARGLGRAQILVIGLCGLVALFDGMDLQSIGLVAPLMAKALQVAPPALGPVFSAALAGLALGALVLGPVADRMGRKRVVIGATVCFAVFTLLTPSAGNIGLLLLYRFLPGLGLGGAMPSFISLTSEYVPRRSRASVVSLMWAGFPLGGVVGGLLASWLIPAFGWRSVFFAGGVPPVVLAIVLAFFLPESLAYLIKHGAPDARIRREITRVFGTLTLAADARFEAEPGSDGQARIGALFTGGRAAGTLLLWVAFFFVFMILVTNSAWSPTLLVTTGMSIDRVPITLAAFNFGSLFASGAAGWLLARFGTLKVLPPSLAACAIAYMLTGFAAPSVPGVIALQTVFGIAAGCASAGLIALAAIVYPTEIRATGVGWSMAAGRLGSFVGPLAVGGLVGLHWTVAGVFSGVGAGVLVGAVAALALGLRGSAPGAEQGAG